MPELRIILAVIGVLFLAALGGWEWWRARNNRERASAVRREDARETARDMKSLPEINVVREPRSSVPDTLPVIQLSDKDESAPAHRGISISEDVAIDVVGGGEPAASRRAEPYVGEDDDVSAVRIVEEPIVHGPQLVLAWPDEAERRIVTLRLVPKTEPRFSGRALRQALASAGFWHGPLDIYHLPDESGRVIVSVAALAQPGTFDPSIMDSQRFSGLNMFTVLPGPLPELEAFDELVHAARTLAERLDATLSDQHGEELTSARITRLRQSLDAPLSQARASGEA